MSSPVAKPPSILTFLRSQQTAVLEEKALDSLKLPRKDLRVLRYLLENLGLRFKTQIKSKLNPKLQGQFDRVYSSYVEIQKGLSKGIRYRCEGFLDKEFFAKTSFIVDDYFKKAKGAITKETIFWPLEKGSYKIQHFLQECLNYPKLDEKHLQLIKKTEQARQRAFRQMIARLDSRAYVKKEDLGIPAGKREVSDQPKPLKKMTRKEERAVTNLIFNGGAIYRNGKPVTYFQLIKEWNAPVVNRFLKRLTLFHWIKEPQPIGTNPNQLQNFHEYLIDQSVENIQDHLNLDFTPALKKIFADAFQNEMVRCDVCYFLADLSHLSKMELTSWDRPSKDMLVTLQLFLRVVTTYQVGGRNQASLLQLLFNRNRNGKWDQLPAVGTPEEFAAAWTGLQSLSKGMAKRAGLPFAELQTQDVGGFKKADAWSLLSFLLQSPKRELFVDMLNPLVEQPNVKMTIPKLLRFCKANEEFVDQESAKLFRESYLGVVGALREAEIEISELQCLWLDIDPPFLLNHPANGEKVRKILQQASANSWVFIEKTKRYHFSKDVRYLSLLRHFLEFPSYVMFDLLADAAAIGIRDPISKEFIGEILEISYDRISPHEATPEIRQKAQKIAANLKRDYGFSNKEIFFLYAEIITLLIADKEEKIRKISEVISRLIAFCPGIKGRDIYFLFLHHPEVEIKEITRLVELRENLAKNEEQLKRFVIDRKEFNKIEKACDELVGILILSCNDEVERDAFKKSFKDALMHAYFPPPQHLTDFFRVRNVTVEGINWNIPDYATHWGQKRSVSDNGTLQVYINWVISRNFPTLFFSFYDTVKKRSFSSFVPLRVSAEELAANQPRASVFWRLLDQLCHCVIGEDVAVVNGWENDEVSTDKKELQLILKGFSDEFKAGIVTQEDVNVMREFLCELKIACRVRYLEALAGRPTPLFQDREPSQAAAAVSIYSSQSQEALIPDFLFPYDNQEYYISNIDDEFVSKCFCKAIFRGQKDLISSELGLKLVVKGKEDGFPISYQVQTSDQVKKKMEEALLENVKENRIDPNTKMGIDSRAFQGGKIEGSFVNLTIEGGIEFPLFYSAEVLQNRNHFEREFRYQVLMLKGMYYHAHRKEG